LTIAKVVNYKFKVDSTEKTEIVANGGKQYLKLSDSNPGATAVKYLAIPADGTTLGVASGGISSQPEGKTITGASGTYLDLTGITTDANIHSDGYIYLASLVEVVFAANAITGTTENVTPSWNGTAGTALDVNGTSGATVYVAKDATLAFKAAAANQELVAVSDKGGANENEESIASPKQAGATASVTAYPVSEKVTIEKRDILRDVELTIGKFQYADPDDDTTYPGEKISEVTVAASGKLTIPAAGWIWTTGADYSESVASDAVPTNTTYKLVIPGVTLVAGNVDGGMGTVTVTGTGDIDPDAEISKIEKGSDGKYTITLYIKPEKDA